MAQLKRIPGASKKLLLIICLVLALVVGGKMATSYFGKPASGQVAVAAPTKSTNSLTIDLTPQPITAKTVSFEYPRGMQQKTPSSLVGPDVEKLLFTAKDISTWNLAIDVTDDGAQPLTNNSGYRYREQHPDMYEQSTVSIAGKPVIVMTDKTAAGFNKVAFLTDGSRRATVSLTGNDAQGTAPLQTTFTMVLSSWRWQ